MRRRTRRPIGHGRAAATNRSGASAPAAGERTAAALARHREALPDLLEGVVGLLADAEAQPQDLLLARCERGENLACLLLERERHGGVGGRQRLPVLHEVAERALLVVPDRGLE